MAQQFELSEPTPTASTQPQKPEPSTSTQPRKFLRIKQVLEIFPVSRSRWWQGVKAGEYPQGIRLSERCTAWLEADILALIDRLAAGQR